MDDRLTDPSGAAPARPAPGEPPEPPATRRPLRGRALFLWLLLAAFYFGVPTRIDRGVGAVRLTLDDANGIPAVFLTYRVGETRLGHPFTAFIRLAPTLEALAVPGGGTFSPSTAVPVSLSRAEQDEVRARLGAELPWLVEPDVDVRWSGIAVDALLLVVTFVVTWLWYGRLLAWRPAPSWPLALLRVAVFAIWPTFLAQNALRLVDPRLYEPLAGSIVTVTRPAGLATLGFLSLLLVVWHTGGRLVARPGDQGDNPAPERPHGAELDL